MGEQRTLFPDLELAPTPAMLAGRSRLYGCHHCGALLCLPSRTAEDGAGETVPPPAHRLPACPGCGAASWHEYEVDHGHIAGPFTARRRVYCEECGGVLEDVEVER